MVQKITLLLFLITHAVTAQEDCLLGVGGKDDDTIIEVFQLKDEQIRTIRNLSAELKYRNELLKNRAHAILETQWQSSPEDLLSMSYEYRALVDSMKNNIRFIDKRLLALFDNKQYALYVKLCSMATLNPMFIERKVNEN